MIFKNRWPIISIFALLICFLPGGRARLPDHVKLRCFLAKNLTSLSYPEIGRRFGNRDHTTIMHAVRKIEELMETDASLADDVSLLKSILAD